MNPRASASPGSDYASGAASRSTISTARVAELLEQYMEALEAGAVTSRDELLQQNPEIAVELAECLEGLELIQQIAPQLTKAVGTEPLTPVPRSGWVITISSAR